MDYALFFFFSFLGGGREGVRRWLKHLFALSNEDAGLIVGQSIGIDIQTMIA